MALCFHRLGLFFWFLLHDHYLAVTLDCLPNEDCFISCADAQTCSRSIINCPVNGTCDIYCGGIESCQETVINATVSTHDVNIFCEEYSGVDPCKDIKVYGSISRTNTGNIHMKCDGFGACSNAEIHCAQHGNCNVSCEQDASCQQMNIVGPIGSKLNIDCIGTHSCSGSILNGSTASILDITASFLLDLSVYCPLNTNGSTNCFLEDGNKYLDTKKYFDSDSSIKIYAMNGWNDIHMESIDVIEFEGKMFCGEHYNISCDISSEDWSCAHEYDLCNNLNTAWNPTKTTTNYADTTETIVNKWHPTKMMTSVNAIIVFSIAALAIVISCIFCMKCIRKWIVRKKSDDADVTVFDLIARSIVNPKIEESDREFESDNDFSGMARKKTSVDPLEISSILSPRLGRQRSGTNTFLSNPISEMDSPRCITTRNRLETDVSMKISDVSVTEAPAPPNYNNIAPPPPRRNKWAGDLSPLSSHNGSDDSDGAHDGKGIKCII